MEPVLILIPGLIGGLVLAAILAGRAILAAKRKGTPSTVVPRRLAAPSPALINMARIQVEGVGGLGLVAVAVAVAISDPRIRLTLIIAGVLGIGLALLLIALRRGTGALPSGGDGPDDRSILHLDGDPQHTELAGPQGADDRGEPGPSPRLLDTATLRV